MSYTKEEFDKLNNTQKINALAEQMDVFATAIKEISATLEEMKSTTAPSVNIASVIPSEVIRSDYKPKGYVPQEYRRIVDEILSPEFGFDTEESTDNMDFKIKIVVPTRFSSLTDQEKAAGMLDTRSKVISRALGENGVREWCMKVRENLNKFYTRSGVTSPFIKQ